MDNPAVYVFWCLLGFSCSPKDEVSVGVIQADVQGQEHQSGPSKLSAHPKPETVDVHNPKEQKCLSDSLRVVCPSVSGSVIILSMRKPQLEIVRFQLHYRPGGRDYTPMRQSLIQTDLFLPDDVMIVAEAELDSEGMISSKADECCKSFGVAATPKTRC